VQQSKSRYFKRILKQIGHTKEYVDMSHGLVQQKDRANGHRMLVGGFFFFSFAVS